MLAAVVFCGIAFGCEAPARRLGDFCSNDYECGKGAACYARRCIKLCAPGERCPEGTECRDYRCLPPGAKSKARAGEASRPTSESSLPAPDPVEAELRAIRVELETIRRQQREILERLER